MTEITVSDLPTGDVRPCTWPIGTCQHWVYQHSKPDPFGRVWMHCEEGLNMGNASLARFLKFCLKNRVEIGSVTAFNPEYRLSQVSASVCIKPEQFDAFEAETGGKLRKPPKIKLNCGDLNDRDHTS